MLGGVVLLLCLACLTCLAAGGLVLFVFVDQTAALPTAKPPSVSTPAGYASVGSPAPDFELPTPGGQTVRLGDLRGQAVVINFWATWCGYCIDEMPLMQRYHDMYASEIVILAVSEGDSRQEVDLFITSTGYTFFFLLDQDYRIGDAYRVDGYPITYFVDPAGILRHRVDGMMEESDMRSGLTAIGVLP